MELMSWFFVGVSIWDLVQKLNDTYKSETNTEDTSDNEDGLGVGANYKRPITFYGYEQYYVTNTNTFQRV